MIRDNYEQLIAKASGAGGMTLDEISAVREMVMYWSEIKQLIEHLNEVKAFSDVMQEMLEWYQRIKQS